MTSRTLLEAMESRAKALENPKPLIVPTGLRLADRAGLIRRGLLTVIGGHPGDGKSAVRKQLAVSAAKAGIRVQEYVLEDPEDLVVDRVFADQLGVSALSLARGEVRDSKARLEAAVRDSSWASRIVMDCNSHSPRTLFEAINDRWEGPLGEPTGLVLLDYVQLFDTDGDEKSMERVVARIAERGLTHAKKTGCGFVIFSQVGRHVAERGMRTFDQARWVAEKNGRPMNANSLSGFRPHYSDLQWSSALGQRAKSVVTLFREGRWATDMGLQGIPDDSMEWYLSKGNFGPSQQRLRFGWDGEKARIYERNK